MIIKLLISFLISYFLGFFYILLFLQNSFLNSIKFLKYFLSMGIGLGLSSILFFLWMLINGDSTNFVFFELTFFILLSVITFFKFKKNKPTDLSINQKTIDLTNQTIKDKLTGWGLSFVAIALLIINFLSFIVYTVVNPYGEEDNIYLWTGKAVFFFRSDNFHWLDIFKNSDILFHSDYPLFIPNIITKTWSYIGKETNVIPVLIAFIFFISTIGLLFFAIKHFKTKNQAFIAVITLLAIPLFLETTVRQTADVPLGFFILASLVLIFAERKNRNNNLIAIIGITSSLCGWIKNEGLLFLALIFIFRFLAFIPLDGIKKVKKDFFKFLMGSLPITLAIIYFKITLAPATDLFTAQNSLSEIFDRIFDISRYLITTKFFITYIVFKLIGIILSCLLIAYALILGIKTEKHSKTGIILISSILVGMIVGYFLIYIVTPYDLIWHIETSLKRLLVQLYPSFLFIYFLIINPLKDSDKSKVIDESGKAHKNY